MQILQRDLHQQLRAESIATRERITPLLRSLDEAKIHEHPDPNKWSIGQVLEHLVKGDELFESPSKKLIAGARPDAGARAREWKPTLLGRMVAGAIQGPRPMKAPKVFQPGPTPRHGIVEAFLAGEMNFLKALDDAVGYDWRALRLSSPALPSWFPKMNLGDALKIHVVHVTRHSQQIERAAAKL
jgi:hypothetical protein